MWTMVAGLLLAQAASGQDANQPKEKKDGKKPAVTVPPPPLVPPGTRPPAPWIPGAPLPVPQPGAMMAAPCPGPFQHMNGKTVVFVANDAMGSASLYDNLREALNETRTCVIAQNVNWTRFIEPRKNYSDRDGQRAAAYRLSCTVLAIRKDAPAARIVFMGHGSGTAVVLAAAEMLPPASIDRIYLLASSLSPCYYLKPALCASRCGIDAFYSREDGGLESLEETIGSTDGHFGPTAGRVGFAVPRLPVFLGTDKQKTLNPDVQLYANLRQVRWNMEMTGVGQGGHTSFLRLRFLRNDIVPQLVLN